MSFDCYSFVWKFDLFKRPCFNVHEFSAVGDLNEIAEKVEFNTVSGYKELVEASSQVNLGIQVSNPDPWSFTVWNVEWSIGP